MYVIWSPSYHVHAQGQFYTLKLKIKIQNLGHLLLTSNCDKIVFAIWCLQKVDGWYYLLNDDVGKRKHLQVPSRTPPTGESEGGTGHGKSRIYNYQLNHHRISITWRFFTFQLWSNHGVFFQLVVSLLLQCSSRRGKH